MIRGVWATPAAREEFEHFELLFAAFAYMEGGPDHVSRSGARFAFFEFAGGRHLVLAERRGFVSLFTEEEIEEEQRKLREERGHD